MSKQVGMLGVELLLVLLQPSLKVLWLKSWNACKLAHTADDVNKDTIHVAIEGANRGFVDVGLKVSHAFM